MAICQKQTFFRCIDQTANLSQRLDGDVAKCFIDLAEDGNYAGALRTLMFHCLFNDMIKLCLRKGFIHVPTPQLVSTMYSCTMRCFSMCSLKMRLTTMGSTFPYVTGCHPNSTTCTMGSSAHN